MMGNVEKIVRVVATELRPAVSDDTPRLRATLAVTFDGQTVRHVIEDDADPMWVGWVARAFGVDCWEMLPGRIAWALVDPEGQVRGFAPLPTEQGATFMFPIGEEES